ncbi:type VI secretion system tip protein VgrG [Pseudomonas sp. TNT19]|uniref:Type VI secretion system tip protein VgrG n=2 Tax=Pseudomonas violetae TaxID=2915813 RepID=A0ABT0F3Z8_9PSED|nr:type VI secretion system tip protein TssI/VgrG [Pseudomonas violetae]MCK1792584.1 type VI secretion system tip protein VgrG [Pseudomonas violetae]
MWFRTLCVPYLPAEARPMHDDKESPFNLTLLKGDLQLQVLQFSGQEVLNQPYRFEIEVIAPAPAVNLGLLLHQEVFFELGNGNGIHGVIQCATAEYLGPHRVGYTVTVVPLLQSLQRCSNRRVFHHLSVPDILLQLLKNHELPDSSYRLELMGQYPSRPFCIQYEETDLELFQRLCEDEGIHFHFEHSRKEHVLVLADDLLSLPQEPVMMAFRPDVDDPSELPKLSQLYQRHHSRPSLVRPGARDRSTATRADNAANLVFSSTTATPTKAHEAQRSLRQLERLRCTSRQIHGQSNHSALCSARVVQVSEHPVPDFNDQWLLTGLRHRGCQASILAQDSGVSEYCNEFTAIPWSTVFRAPLLQPRPIIAGYQPARVVGQPGQPATLDDRGRMLVWLWPSAHSDPDESCAAPVPIAYAVPGRCIDPGTLPAAGSEVLISFLDGNPERPVFCAPAVQLLPSSPGTNTGLLLDWLVER